MKDTAIMIAPSLLAADFLHLADEVEMVNRSVAGMFHVDVMDGHFVPNISFGFSIIKQIHSIARKPLDVHLMIHEPEKYLEAFRDAGASILSVHYETCPHLHRTLQKIRQLGMKPGVVINPHNNVSLLKGILPQADLVLLMSVNPGFGGQSFIETTYQRLEELAGLRQKMDLDFMIEVDGGVGPDNAARLVASGADILVAGTTVFKSADPEKAIKNLHSLALNAREQ